MILKTADFDQQFFFVLNIFCNCYIYVSSNLRLKQISVMLLSPEKKLDLLRVLDFLAEQDVASFQFLAGIVNEVNFAKGETIFSKGDLGGAVFIIAKGCVQIHDEGHIFIELKEGKSFGEYALIKTETRSASASAKSDSVLLRITDDHIQLLEEEFDVRIIDTILNPLRNIRKRMVVKDLLEEELTQQKATIEKQRKELESLNATKDKFFSIIAHDLKNPFASLIGASDLLVENADELSQEQVKTFSGIINKSARQAFRLLENLLTWSRMQTGAIAWKPKEIDLWDLVNEVVILHTGSAENKEINIEAVIDEDLRIPADPNMINTVVRNLVSNAIKFTPRGGSITVSSHVTPNKVEIWVTDTGIGIDSEGKKKLFRIDEQLMKSGTENETGTGLGLILCKEFIEMHNGNIWVESEPGKGSSFKFSLPVSLSSL
ncbi:cyclic nucleotide-binding domain-containing protein [Labilibaculum sp. A4]|uniref:ATP-binding protein n=1 Tax=Labilibaculum euxinus TaxID=2686357 RepID=UPI000F61A726|nr:ATP-binding protein [Labilibaculum euxinus]MDQ1772784.1 ATP-binding protein [Labilibaculum euxinus]MWN75821.1 cyclic nucleotide-binding domain-containing protein [Labilibaculum euxinus]